MYWTELIAQTQQQLTVLTDEINAIKNKRKQRSTKLQKKLFKQYRFLNSQGVEKDLMELLFRYQHCPLLRTLLYPLSYLRRAYR